MHVVAKLTNYITIIRQKGKKFERKLHKNSICFERRNHQSSYLVSFEQQNKTVIGKILKIYWIFQKFDFFLKGEVFFLGWVASGVMNFLSCSWNRVKENQKPQ